MNLSFRTVMFQNKSLRLDQISSSIHLELIEGWPAALSWHLSRAMLLKDCFAVVVLNVLNLIGNSTSQLKTNVSTKREGIIRHSRDPGVPPQHEMWAQSRKWDDHKLCRALCSLFTRIMELHPRKSASVMPKPKTKTHTKSFISWGDLKMNRGRRKWGKGWLLINSWILGLQ